MSLASPPLRHLMISVLILGTATACASKRGANGKTVAPEYQKVNASLSPEAARMALNAYNDTVESVINDMFITLNNLDLDLTQRKAALFMRSRIISQVHKTTRDPNPLKALVDTWSYAARLRVFLEEGDAKNAFGPGQQTAVEAAVDLNQRIELFAQEALGSKHFPEIQKRIQEFNRKYPMTGAFAVPPESPYFAVDQSTKSALSYITDIPMAPVRTIGGLVPGAGSIGDLAATADRFTDVMQGLPEETRIQLKLLMMDLEENDLLTSAVRNFQEVASSSSRMVEVAEDLPERISRETRSVLADVEARQPAFSVLLNDMQGALAEAKSASQSADQTIQSATQMARAWQATADSVGAATREIRALAQPEETPAEPGEEGKPFDINEYTQAAASVTSTALEVRRLIGDLQEFGSSTVLTERVDQINRQADQLLDRSADRAGNLIDRAFTRAIYLAVIVFVLAILYRVLANRFIGKPQRPG